MHTRKSASDGAHQPQFPPPPPPENANNSSLLGNIPLRRRLWLAAVLLAVLVGLAPGVSVQSNTSDTGAALAPAPDAAALLVRMYAWRNDPRYVHTQAHTARWDRALLAFGQPVTDATLTPMTAAEAQGLADRGWERWVPVAAALAELEAQDTAQATDTPAQADPYADLIAQMYEWRNDPHYVHNPAYTARWDRALLAFGEVVPDATLTPMTAAEAQELADRGWERWVPVAAALAELEAPASAIPPPSAAPSPSSTRAAPPPPDQCTLPDDAITAAEVTGWRDALDPVKAAAGIKRWNRVLEALGTDTGTGVPAMTVALAQQVSDWLKNTRWERTARTLAATATCVPPPPPPTPEISITAGSAVTEGSAASFTLTASPAPAADLDVSVAISQSGAFATPGAQTVTITTTGSAALAVPTTNDSVDEPDGSVTATLSAGAGYTVATAAHAATVAVADDDAPPPPDQCTLPDDAITAAEVTGWRDALDPVKAAAGIKRWNRVLEALGTDTGTGVPAMTVALAQQVSDWLKNTRWERTARTLAATATCVPPPPPPTPEISITAGSAVTEGSAASFTLTASPAPAADLDVSVAISQSGAFATPGAQTVTITTTGSAALAVPTTNDSVDEPDGSVTATLSAGAGYTVATAAHAATVAVADDDEPELSIASDGDVTEGSAASFTVTASPPPHVALSASVTVSAAGAFGVSAGAQSLSIPPSGTQSFTVSTTGDATDEPDGSITATLASGTGYTVSASAGSATAAVADDDDPLPTPDLDPAPEAEETATPDPGSEPEAEEIAPACVWPDDAITVSEVTGWRDALDPAKAAAGITRWNRVLEALGTATGTGVSAMTAAQAQQVSDWLKNTRWERTARTLAAAVNCAGTPDEPDATPDTDTPDEPDATPDTDTPDTQTPTTPEISVVGGSAITEGGDATFTVTAHPAPTGTMAITFVAMVTQDGHFTSGDGQVVESIGLSGSNTITVSTLDDDRDEADGSLTLTLQADTRSNPRFTVSATQGAATVIVTDDDAPGSGATPTYTAFWAPYQDLIAKVEAARNHPLFGQFSSHTDLYDSVLLALGRDVAKKSLTPMPAWRARVLAKVPSVDIWDEIGPALTAIEALGPAPAPLPTLDANTWPTAINLSETVEPTQLTLTDYFGHETDAALTFTVTLDNPIATISQWDELISIKNTSTGTATMTVTASDGTHSVTATTALEAVCSPSSRLSYDGTFCVAAQSALSYNGTLSPHPSSPGGPTDAFTADVRLKEGTSGTIEVRVWVNKDDVGDGNCRMRGYITIEPQTGGATIPTGVATNTWGVTSSPHGTHQGWLDGNCSNGFLTFNNRNYRRARITYNLADDGMPGTTLNGAKLVYHDVGASGTSVVGTYDLVNIHFRDSIATVTATMSTGEGTGHTASNGNFTITEATKGTATITLSGEHLRGYLAPREEDIRKGGRASAARMYLEHGHAVYWQPSVCAFNKGANAGGNTDNRTATCEVSWDWLSDGSNGSNGTVKLVWHETDGVGWDAPDVHTTEVNTITMADTGIYRATTNPNGWKATDTTVIANVWLVAAGGQNTTDTPIGNVTTIQEGDQFELTLNSGTRGGNNRVALQVRTATNDDGTQWSAWQNLDQEVGHRALAIREESEWHLYTGNFAECFTPGGYNCFGGDAWKNHATGKRMQLTIVSHDDNFVSHPERYYQFRVKETESTKPNPILKVVEDEAVLFSLHRQQENGQLRVHLAKKVWTDVTLQLDTDSRSSAWNNWAVVYDAEATNDLDRSGSRIIDQGCDGGASDIRVWGHVLVGQHSGVLEYVDHNDGTTDKTDDRKGEYVFVNCD